MSGRFSLPKIYSLIELSIIVHPFFGFIAIIIAIISVQSYEFLGNSAFFYALFFFSPRIFSGVLIVFVFFRCNYALALTVINKISFMKICLANLKLVTLQPQK